MADSNGLRLDSFQLEQLRQFSTLGDRVSRLEGRAENWATKDDVSNARFSALVVVLTIGTGIAAALIITVGNALITLIRSG